MFQGLRTVIYRVPDLARAKAWYSEAFGIQPYFDEPFYVGFNIGGYELGLDPNASAAHPDNGGKAQFFASLGFARDDPERLRRALREVAEHGEVVKSGESSHGERYVVDGWLSAHTEGSRQWSVPTVWIIDRGGDAPRLVTAYPGKE